MQKLKTNFFTIMSSVYKIWLHIEKCYRERRMRTYIQLFSRENKRKRNVIIRRKYRKCKEKVKGE